MMKNLFTSAKTPNNKYLLVVKFSIKRTPDGITENYRITEISFKSKDNKSLYIIFSSSA